jgi:hypothetical protein
MDNPDSNGSYNMQFLQQGASNTHLLQEAVEDMLNSASWAKVFKYITGFIFHQMSAKAGIKKHGQAAINALLQEFLQ